MPWTPNQRIEWALDDFSRQYKIGWIVPKDGNYDPNDHERSKAAQRIIGIPESKIGTYPYEQLFGRNDKGDGGWIWHTSLYWSGPNPIQNALRYRRHKIALQRFRDTHSQHFASGISPRGVQFITDFEGYYPNWYDDGFGNQTIGYGHTTESLHGLTPPLSRAEALQLLRWDLSASYEPEVRKAINRPLTQGQFDALTSFVFNLGTDILYDGGNNSVASRINRGDFGGAANWILGYDHANGQKVPGLTRRRQAERGLFLS